MHIKKGDKVQIISGEFKGHVGEVLQAFPKTNRVIVEGANVQIKHQKAMQMGGESGRIEKEGPIDASKVLLYSEELKKGCLLYTSPSPRDRTRSRMPSSA